VILYIKTRIVGREPHQLALVNEEPSSTVNWQETFIDLMPKLYHYFCYRTGDPGLAEDLTSTTFLKAWEKRSKYDSSKAPFSHWVFGIAKNVCAQHYRKNNPIEFPLREDLFASNGRSTEEAVRLRADFRRLSAILSGLPNREHELVSLKYGAGFTNREISAQTGLSETNVGTILHRVINRLSVDWEQCNE
jgi:RNA polymerase sigma-70 factor (ECF subfamily)